MPSKSLHILLFVPSFAVVVPLAARADVARTLGGVPLREELDRYRREQNQGWHESPLWGQAPLTSPGEGEVTRGQFFNALSDQMPALAEVRNWRSSLRGRDRNGAPAAAREVRLGQPFGTAAKLQLGSQSLPQSNLANFAGMAQNGAAPAAVAQWGRVQAGSTVPLVTANRALRDFDEYTEDTQPDASLTAPRLTWAQVRAVEQKHGNFDVLAARGSRALVPGAAPGSAPQGTVWGGKGQMALLPSQLKNWNLRGEWMNSRLDGQQNAAHAWNVGVDGPVAHPFGEARVSADYNATDAGFAPFSDPSAAALAANNERRTREQVTVAQDAKLQLPLLGTLSGTLSASAARSNRKSLNESGESAPVLETPGSVPNETRTDELTGTADLRLQLLPAIALTGRHSHGLISEEHPARVAASENLTLRNDSDAGVELKMSRALALTVGAGQTRVGNATLAPTVAGVYDPLNATLRDEDRVTVGVRHQTGGGSVNLSLARRLIDTNTLDRADFSGGSGDTLAHTVNLDAQRRFFGFLNLQGGWSWSNEDAYARGADGLLTPGTQRTQTRRAQAQVSLPFSSRFDLSYQDWLQQNGQGGAALGTVNGTREYGARYVLGPQDGAAGIGLSVEYSRREFASSDPLNTWRVGVTYR